MRAFSAHRAGAATALIALTLANVAAEPPSVAARALAREAVAAADEKNYPRYLEKMTAAVALRPDYPRLLVNLAAAQALNELPADALATLNRLADLGAHSAVDKAEEFAALRPLKEFAAVVARLAANAQPAGEGELAFALRDMTGLIEGLAWRAKTGEFFLGDVHHRCVWVRAPDGKVRRFTPEGDALLGVFGLAVDEERGALWAATTALPEMAGFTAELKGAAGLAEIDLATGEVRRVARLPDDHGHHVIGDLALAPDGTVYAPDSGVPALWRLAPGAAAPELFAESDEFISLQGAVVWPGGALILSDYANGLLRLDPATRAVRRLDAPADATLLGLDGLALAPDGTLLAVQNGIRPLRILRLALDAAADTVTAVTVLERAHLRMADPTLGCVAGDSFVFIANAGWSRFEAGGEGEKPRPVPVFKTKLVTAAPAKALTAPPR